MVDENFPGECQVRLVYKRRGGGFGAMCSNGEKFMLYVLKGKPITLRCSMLDKYRAKGIELGVSTAECEGL